jgi:hypothetical protein
VRKMLSNLGKEDGENTLYGRYRWWTEGVRAARREVPRKYALFSFLHRRRSRRGQNTGSGLSVFGQRSILRVLAPTFVSEAPCQPGGKVRVRAVACALVRCRGASRLGGALSAKKKRGSTTAGG